MMMDYDGGWGWWAFWWCAMCDNLFADGEDKADEFV